MKLVALLSLGVLAIAASVAPTAQAESRTPAEATAHALEEFANAVAQGKITLTPTPTAIPSSTPVPTATTTPVPTSTSEPSATPLPALPVPDATAGPLAGYVRPSTLADPDVLELALPQGRWDIRLVSDNCQDLLGTWTDVLLVRSDLGPALVDRAYFTDQWQWGPCAIAQAAWHADAPCASATDGTCEANVDPVLIVALGDPEPTPVPTVASTPAPVPPPAPAPRQAAAVAPIREVVVQTVVVFVTIEPTDTPIPSPTRTAAPATAAPSRTPPRTPVPGVTAMAAPAVVMSPTATASDNFGRARAALSTANRGWLFGIALGCLAVAAVIFWLTRGRRRYVL